MKQFHLVLIVMLCESSLFAQDAPLPPRVAAAKMTLPDGFKATLFAGEPDVVQPIAFCFDDRGRLWVAECMSYPNWQADPKQGKDRIVIFEDTDGDGVHDKRTVFANNIQNISGINYGFGGIWVCATPNLLFIPIKDDKPAGPPEIVLDGWSLKAGHNVFNSLTWGPDGWLYGCNGIVATSKVGTPGTPEKDRITLNCGVWRYHPTKKKFEAVAHGTTNPWGLDFDEHGEMFITNCVIDHLWHVVPGAHYLRMYGSDLNPNVYKLMPSICDHIHWGGGSWTSSRGGKGVHSEAGGGHAHVGCMIYLGDNWPDRYRGGVFMCNLHGSRINHDILERNGSTYVARHGKDFMLANDPWFRGIALAYGPDGGVYVSDWTDTGECHNYREVDRTNGRIFKITYGDVKPFKGDLAKLSDLELAKLQMHKNQWMARHARRLLQERAAVRKISADAIAQLRDDRWVWITAFWTLQVINELTKNDLLEATESAREQYRAWAVRFMFEPGKLDAETGRVVRSLACKDPSPLVRLHIASGMQRLPAKDRFTSSLTEYHREDTNDPFLPLMYWYAVEPDPSGAWVSQFPLIREYGARRITATDANAINEILDGIKDIKYNTGLKYNTWHRDILRGISDGLSGVRRLPMPKAWKEAYPILIESPLPEVRERALALAVKFGDERAFTLLRKIVPDRNQPAKQREEALKTLLFQQKPDMIPILHDLLQDDALRGQAIRGLAAFDDPMTPKLLLKNYARFSGEEKSDAIQTLSSRPKYALDVLGAIENNTLPRQDINSYTIRQWQSLKSPEVNARLAKVWGEIRQASAEKSKLMTKYKSELKQDVLKKANLNNGRALYAKACANCHRLYGEGGDIGPDLTGSQRNNLDYILENVLDPSAIVPREYQVTVLVTNGGRTLTGIIKKESEQALTVQTQNEVVVVPKSDIETRTASKLSMMPDGIFEQLRLEEVRDLVAYLASPVQIPTMGEKKK